MFISRDGANIQVVEPDRIREVTGRFPSPILRGGCEFYSTTKETRIGPDTIMPRMLDVGYVEFLIDMITGSLGIYTGQDGQKQIWRRHNTTMIDSGCEVFYGVAKPYTGS